MVYTFSLLKFQGIGRFFSLRTAAPMPKLRKLPPTTKALASVLLMIVDSAHVHNNVFASSGVDA
jgi:hypothetical protein